MMHVTEMVSTILWDHHLDVTVVVLDPHLLNVAGVVVILQLLAVVMILIGNLQHVWEVLRIAVEVDAAEVMITANVAPNAVAAIHLPEQTPVDPSGLDTTLRLVKETLKVIHQFVCIHVWIYSNKTYSSQSHFVCWWSYVSQTPWFLIIQIVLFESLSFILTFYSSSEHELKGLFNQYGDVQTCIVNKEKRHAFVKMVSREHAVKAKEAMEKNRSPDSSLRVCTLHINTFHTQTDC